MKSIPSSIVGALGILSLMSGGCSTGGNIVRTEPTTAMRPAATLMERQEERARYVDAKAPWLEKTGRFASPEEARVYAGYEWDRYEQHRISAPDAATTRRSHDADARKQKQLEADLAKLDGH